MWCLQPHFVKTGPAIKPHGRDMDGLDRWVEGRAAYQVHITKTAMENTWKITFFSVWMGHEQTLGHDMTWPTSTKTWKTWSFSHKRGMGHPWMGIDSCCQWMGDIGWPSRAGSSGLAPMSTRFGCGPQTEVFRLCPRHYVTTCSYWPEKPPFEIDVQYHYQ